ncbi:transcriptional regulator, TetR family [Microbacterium sp. cf046]|uniref:TetR/AcrR family transcriptional regulator n=1 Tax=Microbacterium sp. cf046 TaxID=1761803 RepID=UPI0008E1F060|nr:TetR/AcrR family transcriptional regulator [Microbacterium sp. cf046]SFS16848.1 transcriptional regulator, TetR family [Microbacterium sp. cf046]
MARMGTSAKGKARRQQILATAMERLGADGYRNTSLRGIGRALGVEPAHILYYFDSREELLQKVIEKWDQNTIEVFGGGPVPSDRTLDLYADAIRYNQRIPGIVHLYLTLAAEAVHPDHTAHAFFVERFRTVRELLRDAISFEQSAGLIDSALDADMESRKLIALADGLQLQGLVDPTIDAPRDLEAAIAGLRTRPIR